MREKINIAVMSIATPLIFRLNNANHYLELHGLHDDL